MAAVKRGFAAEADRLAAVVRDELGLSGDDRFDPFALASEYGVPVLPLTDLLDEGADPKSIWQLTIVDSGSFSAGTVLVGTKRLVVFNPAQSDGRLANSLAHELAHLILEHQPGSALGPGGCRVWDPVMEAEADLLASVLLVTREAALACARAGLPHAIGAARFGVSLELMRWRTGQSGATRQASAEAARRGRVIPRVSPMDVTRAVVGCDPKWLQALSAADWRATLTACAQAVRSGSVEALSACLHP